MKEGLNLLYRLWLRVHTIDLHQEQNKNASKGDEDA